MTLLASSHGAAILRTVYYGGTKVTKVKKAIAALLVFCPSRIKILVMNLMGHDISHSAYIGASYIGVELVTMGADTYIGHGNIITNLHRLEMLSGSRINRWNRVTSNGSKKAVMKLRDNASISLRHYFDVCDLVDIGCNTIVAGHRSTFFTHSKGTSAIDYTKPIAIGDWCYIGSNVCFPPGASVGDHCFVGMGAVVSGNWSAHNYSLLAGNPIRVKRKIDHECAYFQQPKIIHPHHRKG